MVDLRGIVNYHSIRRLQEKGSCTSRLYAPIIAKERKLDLSIEEVAQAEDTRVV